MGLRTYHLIQNNDLVEKIWVLEGKTGGEGWWRPNREGKGAVHCANSEDKN